MCAIIGVLGKNLPDQEQFKKARDTMTHRGPDDAGLYYAPEEGVALGHRRLSIIDLSADGRQPLFSSDKKMAIVFNGEIYNFKELRKELEGSYRFRTRTDTEVILAAYKKWGVGCLGHLQGMFAFALWDIEKKELFVARDRLGVKPLYYSVQNGTLLVASEIKAILALFAGKRVLNKRGFLDYLSYRYPLGEETFFEGIFSFKSGYYAIIKNGSMPVLKKYWELPVVSKKVDGGEGEVLAAMEKLLTETVRSHMVSDVPLGAYLSGGVDSSVLTAIMAALSPKPVKTFSVGFSEKGFNEFAHARIVAKALKTDHHELNMRGDEYLSLLPETIRLKDAPLHVPNEVPLYALSKELKKYITVVLSGEGADELFGGYGRVFRSGYDFLRMHGGGLEDFTAEEKETLRSNLQEKYGTIYPKDLADHLLVQYPYTSYQDTHAILNKDVFSLTKEEVLNKQFIEKALATAEALPPEEQLMHFFQRVHLLGILGRLDNAAMGASVEGRVPFVDHVFVEHVSALPPHYKLRWKSEEDRTLSKTLHSGQISEVHDDTKYLLRKIGEKLLPPEITWRTKLGFPVPLDAWSDGVLKKTTHELLLSTDSRSRALYDIKTLERWLSPEGISGLNKQGRNIWALLNVEIWMRECNVTF